MELDRELGDELTDLPWKACEQCDTRFGPSEGQRQRPTRWAKVRFCSRKCSARFARTLQSITELPTELSICEGCNEPYERREKEKPSDYKRRRFCGKSCASRYANSCRDFGSVLTVVADPKPRSHKSKPVAVEIPPEPEIESKMIWRPASLGGPYLWTPGMLERPSTTAGATV